MRGKCGIYREGGLIKYIKIEEVSVDDSQLSLSLLPINVPGFSTRISNVFKVGVHLEFLRIENNYIAAPVVNWCLVFCPLAISHLLQIGKAEGKTSSVQKEFIALRRCGFKLQQDNSLRDHVQNSTPATSIEAHKLRAVTA